MSHRFRNDLGVVQELVRQLADRLLLPGIWFWQGPQAALVDDLADELPDDMAWGLEDVEGFEALEELEELAAAARCRG